MLFLNACLFPTPIPLLIFPPSADPLMVHYIVDSLVPSLLILIIFTLIFILHVFYFIPSSDELLLITSSYDISLIPSSADLSLIRILADLLLYPFSVDPKLITSTNLLLIPLLCSCFNKFLPTYHFILNFRLSSSLIALLRESSIYQSLLIAPSIYPELFPFSSCLQVFSP